MKAQLVFRDLFLKVPQPIVTTGARIAWTANRQTVKVLTNRPIYRLGVTTLERVVSLGRSLGSLLGVVVLAAMLAGIVASPADAANRRLKAGVVIDAGTGTVLYQHNVDARIYPASLTKMMTLYLAFEAVEKGVLKMNQRLSVSRHASRQPRVKLGLRAGSTIQLKDAIMSMIVRSSNDSAVVVAEANGRTESGFARRMNQKAQELGMLNTRFRNANGLPNRAQHSTVRDLSTLSLALIRDFPQYYPWFSTRTFTWKGRRMTSTNKLLRGFPGLDGLKTGFINDSGYNLAASAKRNGRRLVAVVVGGRTGARRNSEVRRILGIGFKRASANTRIQLATRPLPPVRPDAKTIRPGTLLSRINLDVVGTAHAAPPPRPEVRPRPGDYGVQVGAFSSENRARTGARQAVTAAPDLLQSRPVAIDEIPNKRRSIYRARLLDLSLAEARQTCQTLRSKRLDCLVVRTQ